MKDVIILFALYVLVTGIIASNESYPLFNFFPSLKNIPKIKIIIGYTPLQKLSLYKEAFQFKNEIYIKRDDLTEPPYLEPTRLGGNKARKLEFIFSDAQRLGRHSLICPGEWGTNTGFSIAALADHLKFGQVELIVGPQPITKDVREKLLAAHALGAKLSYYGNDYSLILGITWSMATTRFSSSRYFINGGASSDLSDLPYLGWLLLKNPIDTTKLGDLGFINAFLELQEQFNSIGQELPSEIYVPAGSLGTSAGLLVGNCLAGTLDKVTIVAVQVGPGMACNSSLMVSKAKRLMKFFEEYLSEEDKKKLPKCDFTKGFKWVSDYYEPGYGSPHSGQTEVTESIKKIENLTVDVTYTGKSFLAMHNRLLAQKDTKSVLFWQTYIAYDLNIIIDAFNWTDKNAPWKDLPSSFHHIFENK